MDIEVPARGPRHFSEIKREHRHLLELETVLFSVFYPSGLYEQSLIIHFLFLLLYISSSYSSCYEILPPGLTTSSGNGQGKSPEGEKKWSRPTWLTRPRIEVAKGYGEFAGLLPWLSIAWFGVTTAFTKLPAFRNSRLAEHWPAEKNARDAGTYQTKNKAGKPPPGEPEQPCFPLLIFSHGLGGTRTTYSSLCGEFASYGFIVVALEHRDGSGPRTYINLPKDGKLENENVEFSDKAKKKGYSRMDYVFPQHNKRDTMPGNKQGVDAELRAAQIQLRLAEIEEAYHVMTLIHDGRGEEVAASSLRLKGDGRIGGSSRGLKGINWSAWKDRFHLQQVTMIGHSFGAATTVEVLRHQDDRFRNIGQGIIYDIWGAAIQPPESEPGHRIRAPLLGINSEAFMYWPDNFKSVMTLCKETKEQGCLCWLMTVRGSVHVSQSDFSLLYPTIASLLLKMTVNPRRAIDLNINASLEFLKLVMPARISAMNRGTNEHLLEVSTLDKLPEEHRPNDNWIAVRLRIPHELRIRLTPAWVRRHTRKKMQKEKRKTLPKDPLGHELEGLEELAVGEEVWMHVAPTVEELEEYGIDAKGRGKLQGAHAGDGMVEVTGNEGRSRGQRRGVEQRYMERG
jgi:platelet-activating factor acetylhydrolase